MKRTLSHEQEELIHNPAATQGRGQALPNHPAGSAARITGCVFTTDSHAGEFYGRISIGREETEELAIQRAVLDGFEELGGLDFFRAGEIGDGGMGKDIGDLRLGYWVAEAHARRPLTRCAPVHPPPIQVGKQLF